MTTDKAAVVPVDETKPSCSECGHKGGTETDMGYACPVCSAARLAAE